MYIWDREIGDYGLSYLLVSGNDTRKTTEEILRKKQPFA